MHSFTSRLIPVLALALAACASTGRTPIAVTPAAPAAAPADFTPTGEVRLVAMGAASSSAAFNGWRVTGPRIDVSRHADGTWGGSVVDLPVRLSVKDGRISGVGLNLAVERAGDVVEIGGVLGDVRVRFEVSPRHLHGTVGRRTLEMVASGPGEYVGNGRILRLTGAAADLSAPSMPQLALALVAASSE